VKNLTGTLILVAAISIITLGRAQAACPAGLTNPNLFLNGTFWAFQTEDGYGDAAIGIFAATATASAFSGTLTGNETSNSYRGQIIIQAALNGHFTVNPDCLGGTLSFNVNGIALQYVFVVAGSQLYLLSSSLPPVQQVEEANNLVNNSVNLTSAAYAANRGIAYQMSGPPQCSASPLSTLVGNWFFRTQAYASASIGTFTAQVTSPTPFAGSLTATQSSSGDGFLQLGEAFNGSYVVLPDCSGGSIVLPYGNDSWTYEFVFANPKLILMVSDNADQFSQTYGVYEGRHGTAEMLP
jgi:hypothetical protein